MKLSIITINLNNAIGLKKTIESVQNQTFKDFEYILIDGGSNDESLDVITHYLNNINFYVSETDKGIYDAMNKGINVAGGEYLLMLNSGDTLADNTVLTRVFASTTQADIIYGNIRWNSNGQFHSYGNFPENLSFTYFWQRSIGHQAAFIKKSVHHIIGNYDENMKICADWKFFLLAFEKYKFSFLYLPLTISEGDTNGLSWDPTNISIINKEKEKTIRIFFPDHYKEYKKFQKANRPSLRTELLILKKKIKKVLNQI